ncbi:MAG: MFS transporter, partial [Rhodospirillaceae bacterium]
MSDAAGAAGSLFADRAFVRVWVIGVLIGVVRWLEFLAIGIFAYDVTGSAFLVALLALLRFLPLALFGVVIGALSDLFDTPRLLRYGMAGASVVSMVMTALFVAGVAEYWHVAVSVFLSGVVWASDQPWRRKLIGEIAGPDRLGRAMAMDAATSNGTRMLGPLLGGVVYQWLGGAGVFAVGVVMYFVAYLMLARVQGVAAPPASQAGAAGSWWLRPLAGAWQAVRYAAADREVMCILGVTVVFNIWGFPMLSMVPVIGKDELALPASAIGAMSALEGACAFIGAVTLARFARPAGRRRFYFGGVCVLHMVIFIMGMVPGEMTLVLGLLGFGFSAACFSSMQSTLAYQVAPLEMRGRLLGLITICIGSGLIGFANIGALAEAFGASTALWIVALEGAVPLIVIGVAWREIW